MVSNLWLQHNFIIFSIRNVKIKYFNCKNNNDFCVLLFSFPNRKKIGMKWKIYTRSKKNFSLKLRKTIQEKKNSNYEKERKILNWQTKIHLSNKIYTISLLMYLLTSMMLIMVMKMMIVMGWWADGLELILIRIARFFFQTRMNNETRTATTFEYTIV